MAVKLGWFAIESVGADQIRARLEEARRLVSRATDCPYFRVVDPGSGWSSVLLMVDHACVAEWARAVSNVSSRKTVSFHVFEGTRTCVVIERGDRTAEHAETPGDQWSHLAFAKTFGPIEYPGPHHPKAFEIDWRRPRRGPVSRPLVEADVETVLGILEKRPPPNEEPFAVRFTRWMEIAKDGFAADLAEVYRELARRRQDGLSFGEKRMLDVVRDRLASKISGALGDSRAEALFIIGRSASE